MIAFRWPAAVTVATLVCSNVSMHAQSPEPFAAAFANSAAEQRLRILQLVGASPIHQWSIRSFTPAELRALARRMDPVDWPADTSRAVRPRVRRLPATLTGWYNTAFPTGYNDGPVWRGRGVTGAADGGVSIEMRAASLTIAPVAFWAQNQEFDLMPNGLAGALRFADGQRPMQVDWPQRFGDASYGRLDPGQSTLRVEGFGLTGGISAANQWWGPMGEFPFVLGNNAAGFPHAFAGSNSPWNVFIGRVHGRMYFGELQQSAFTTIADSARRRFVSALVGVFQPRGIPGLEIGGSRFFQGVWPRRGVTLRHVTLPIRKGFSKVSNAEDPELPDNPFEDVYNQLGSLFARWVFPGSGIEAYGEIGREDNSWNTRDLILQTDHATSYGAGVTKAWRKGTDIHAVKAEFITARYGNVKNRGGRGAFYTHHIVRQGHTHQGQLLGTPLGVGSFGGTSASYRRLGADRDLAFTWRSYVRRDFRENVSPMPQEPDVVHEVTFERTVRCGVLSFRHGLGLHYELNRDLGSDRVNVSFVTSLTRR